MNDVIKPMYHIPWYWF